MESLSDQKLVRMVKILLDIILGGLVLASIFLVLWIALSPLLLNATGIVITASVPVVIGEGEEPQFNVVVADAETRGIQAAFVDSARGTLRLETSDWSMILTSNLARLLTAVGLAYVIYLLRLVFQAILEGETFSPENTRRIRRIGYMVLLVGFFRALVAYIASSVILNQLTILDPALSPPPPFEVELLLASLLILVLAQVWSYGNELEHDRALTI